MCVFCFGVAFIMQSTWRGRGRLPRAMEQDFSLSSPLTIYCFVCFAYVAWIAREWRLDLFRNMFVHGRSLIALRHDLFLSIDYIVYFLFCRNECAGAARTLSGWRRREAQAAAQYRG